MSKPNKIKIKLIFIYPVFTLKIDSDSKPKMKAAFYKSVIIKTINFVYLNK